MQKSMAQKNYHGISITILLVAASAYFFTLQCNKNSFQGNVPFEQVTLLLNELYRDKSGFGIPREEAEIIRATGGLPAYGEISYKAVNRVLRNLFITNDDVLYDLGSGVGKMVLQSYLSFPFKKVIGIELSKHRYTQSIKARNLLEQKGFVNLNCTPLFLQEDFAKSSIDDATVIYIGLKNCSDNFMTMVVKKLAKLKKGLRVITLQRLPNSDFYNFTFLKEYRLPMSWTRSSSIYVYELNQD